MTVQRICAQCGQVFEIAESRLKYGAGKHCSKSCANKAMTKKVELTCPYCGSAFFRKPSDVAHGSGKYCSLKCRYADSSPLIIRNCAHCGEDFSFRAMPSAIDRRFCSTECKYESRKVSNKVIDYGDYLGLELTDRSGRRVAVALIDREDYDKARAYRWVMGRQGRNKGMVAAMFKDETGKYKGALLHRLVIDPPAGYVVDHINHNRLDNRKTNLRIATLSQNAMNRTPQKRPWPLGISYRADQTNYPYVACITGGGIKHQKSFATLEEAVAARRRWEQELHGEWAYTESIRQGPVTPAYASTMSAGGIANVTIIV